MSKTKRSEIALTLEDKKSDLRAFLVVEDTLCGPGKGGLRMTPGVTLEEVKRLAKTMSWKNRLFELPFGGAKSGIVWEGGSDELKERLVRSFARKIRHLIPGTYIAGPDVSTGEREMAWIADELDCFDASTGKPADYCRQINGKRCCGLPHELGSTGFGVAVATILMAKLLNLKPAATTVAIHGFGNVGMFAAKHLLQESYKVVLLADSRGALYRNGGFKLAEIERVINDKARLSTLDGQQLSSEEFWKLPVDILIPASASDVINDNNKHQISCKLLVEGANIPITAAIEAQLESKGIVIVPDFVANGGGIISSYAELRRFTAAQMFKLVEKKITEVTGQVMTLTLSKQLSARAVALELARSRR